MGTQPSPQKGGGTPAQFSAHVYCGQMAGWTKIALFMQVDLNPGHCVRCSPSPKRGRSPTPQYLAHFYCGQTARCIKLPLGMEVGLSPGDFVIDVDLARLPERGWSPPVTLH